MYMIVTKINSALVINTEIEAIVTNLNLSLAGSWLLPLCSPYVHVMLPLQEVGQIDSELQPTHASQLNMM